MEIVSHDELHVDNEETEEVVFDAILKWVRHIPGNTDQNRPENHQDLEEAEEINILCNN